MRTGTLGHPVSEPSNAFAQLSSGARSLALCIRRLTLVPYIVCPNSEGSGEIVGMCRLA